MQWLTNNLQLVFTIISILLGTAGTIFGLLKKKAPSKVLQGLAEVVAQIPTFIRTAERIADTGEDKLAYVLNQVKLYCQARGFTPTNDQLEDIKQQINDQVKLSKDINKQVKTFVTISKDPTITALEQMAGKNTL